MKVLVTGATGFVGYHVARLLQEKSLAVRALVRPSSDVGPLKNLNIELVTGDIRDLASVRNALSGCLQVYHVAADYRLWVPNPITMYDHMISCAGSMAAWASFECRRVIIT